MSYKNKTNCPFSFSLSLFGDKWTILILREIIFFQKCHYQELLTITEGISTNILADRLNEMIENKLLTKSKDPENKKRWIYRPTSKSLDLIPLLFEMALWAEKYDPNSDVTSEHVERFTKKRSKTIAALRKPFL